MRLHVHNIVCYYTNIVYIKKIKQTYSLVLVFIDKSSVFPENQNRLSQCIFKYLHLCFHCFDILYRTNEVHSYHRAKVRKTLMTSGIPRYF